MLAPSSTPTALVQQTAQAPSAPHANTAPAELRAKAEELEGVFLNTLMSQMFNSIDARSGFGGGYAEETWRSMQAEQIANAISKAGGLGLADQIVANLMANQQSNQINASPAQAIKAYEQ